MPAFLAILRPLNLLQATLAVILTTAFLGQMDQLPYLILLILSVTTINAGGNIINDIYDIEIDYINRPDRPLPSGAMSVSQARIYLSILFATGILCSWFITIETFVIATFISVPVLIAYSARLKRLPLVGNLTVSFMLGLAFIYVGAAFGKIQVTLVMAALAFGFTLIRELIKDLEDMEGDARHGARTLPLVWGEQATVNFTVALMGLSMIFFLFPAVFGPYSDLYLWIILIGMDLPMLMAMILLCRFPEKKKLSPNSVIFKTQYFCWTRCTLSWATTLAAFYFWSFKKDFLCPTLFIFITIRTIHFWMGLPALIR